MVTIQPSEGNQDDRQLQQLVPMNLVILVQPAQMERHVTCIASAQVTIVGIGGAQSEGYAELMY